MKRKILKEWHEKIVKTFLEIVVLNNSRDPDTPISGYDVICFIHDKFDVQLGSGRVYYLLLSMERDGLIQSRFVGRKRVYRLTNKGEKRIKTILEAKERILGKVDDLFT